MYLGDYAEDATVRFLWNTNGLGGESITRATNGTISVYKDSNTTQSTAGVTDTEDFDSVTGVHSCVIDTSADAFYAAGSEYSVVLSGATIDGETINACIANFSIERAGAVLALLKGANGLVAIKTQTAAIETDTQDLQSRTPAALVGGRMDSNVGAISADATAADNLEAALDGTGGVTITAGLTGNVTGNLSGSVGSVTGAVGSVTGNVGGNVAGSVGSLTTNNDKTGYRLSATGVDDVLDEVVEGTTTLRQMLRGFASALLAKLSGGATTTVVVRDIGDTKDRITATVDGDGNRSAITLDLT